MRIVSEMYIWAHLSLETPLGKIYINLFKFIFQIIKSLYHFSHDTNDNILTKALAVFVHTMKVSGVQNHKIGPH